MMRTIPFPRFRPSYLVAPCSIAIAATCAYQAPSLMQAALVVGADTQLPLERLAADAEASAPEASERTLVRARPATHKLDRSRRRGRAVNEHHSGDGDEGNVPGYKYWT